MAPKPDGRKSKNRARLSVARKDDRKGNVKLQNGPSITSFFKNTPPSKLACPLCGRFIPRFKINEHIDSQCRDFLGENNVQADAARDGERAKTSWAFSNDARQSPGEKKNAGTHGNNQEAKTSPYFKKSGTTRQESPEKSSNAEEGKTVSPGRLSSKLSRKVLFSSQDSKVHSTQVSVKEEPTLSEPSSSQKENFENVSVNAEHLVMNSTSTSQVRAENLPHFKKIEPATPKVEALGPGDSQSAKCPASLRLNKRKKEKSPGAGVAPDMPKKTRHLEERTSKSGSTDHLPKDGLHKSECKDVEWSQVTAPDRGSDLAQDASISSVKHGSPKRLYYLQNFLTVLGTVLENKDDRVLFSEEELFSIQRFKQLSGKEHTSEHN